MKTLLLSNAQRVEPSDRTETACDSKHWVQCDGGLYHLWVEAIVGELPNKRPLVGPRLLHQVLLDPLNGLEVVLQQAAQHTQETAFYQKWPRKIAGLLHPPSPKKINSKVNPSPIFPPWINTAFY